MLAEAPGQIRAASEWRMAAAEASRDFLTYCAFVRGYMPAAHHLVIAERLVYGGAYELILGCPDLAKTQYGVMFAEWTLGRDPSYRWLIASEVISGIAGQVVNEIAETITNNERYHMTFGVMRHQTTGVGYSFDLQQHVSFEEARRRHIMPTPPPPFPWLPPRGRPPGLRGNSVKAVGWRTGYTGVRADGIIGDDLVSDRSSRSAVITRTVHSTLHQKMIPRLTGKKRRVILFGQRWAPRDLFGILLEAGVVVYDSNPLKQGLEVLGNTQEDW